MKKGSDYLIWQYAKRTWVNCPICDEPDMRKEEDEDGNALILCVNHNCGSNGGSDFSAVGQSAHSPMAYETFVLLKKAVEAQCEATGKALTERDTALRELAAAQETIAKLRRERDIAVSCSAAKSERIKEMETEKSAELEILRAIHEPVLRLINTTDVAGYISQLRADLERKDAAIAQLRNALGTIAVIRWGYDGDCGAVAIAENALTPTPETQEGAR